MKRFWQKVKKTDGCWLWVASKTDKGYGKFGVGTKTKRAHRVAYELLIGEIPEGMCVCHTCDEPACVNPDHLWLGTHADNMSDCKNKNRHKAPGGQKHWSSKLCELDVWLIRNVDATSEQIADFFGITESHAGKIQRGHYWKNVT